MIIWKLVPALVCLIAVVGCSITPPKTDNSELCGFDRYQLEVALPDQADALESRMVESEPSFAAELRRVAGTETDDTQSMLFLSGGSQDGAFGAGFLRRWAERREGRLPNFKVVTGVSTGSIQSTFAFANRTETLVENARITEEGQLLDTFVDNGDLGLSAAIAVAQRGAIADLAPLRRLLRTQIDGGVLASVAEANAAGRRLYVGVVDVDTGMGVALDMTAMAKRYVEATDDAERTRYRNCYTEAIIASSSVPMAALPAFIDNRMYIDGGARFGVFSDHIGEIIDDQRRRLAPDVLLGPPFYYVIVNGDLMVSEKCGKADPAAFCPEGITGGLEGAHANWRFTDLASRSVSILIDQVYRFSTARIAELAEGTTTKLAYIRHPGVDEFVAPVDNPVLGTGERTCPAWRELDDKLDNPVEFHPRYMHCLIRYGMAEAERLKWWKLE